MLSVAKCDIFKMFSGYFVLTLMCPALLHGFTLDEKSPKDLKPPGLSAESLLGWSIAHQKNDIILGAPLQDVKGNLLSSANII